MPFSLISLMRLPGLAVASIWKVYWLAPAAAMGFTHCSGLDTIICMSVIRQRVSKVLKPTQSKHCNVFTYLVYPRGNVYLGIRKVSENMKEPRVSTSLLTWLLTKVPQRRGPDCVQLKLNKLRVDAILQWLNLPKNGSGPIVCRKHSTIGCPNVMFGTKCLK